MALSTTNVSMRDVKNVLMEKANDLWGLCRSNRINKWSKYKPVFYKSKNVTGKDLTAVWGNSGFVVVRAATTTQEGLIEYLLPPDATECAHRLGDFRGYDHEAEAPFVINPAIEKPVIGGSSGVFEYTITVKVPTFIMTLAAEFNNLGFINFFENVNGTWTYKTAAPLKEGYVDISDSLTYNNIGNLQLIKKEYLIVYSRYNVAGSGLQDRFTIGPRLTCSAGVRAFDGDNNAVIELINFPKWFNDICMGNPNSLARITNQSTHIRFRVALRRPMTDAELTLIANMDCNLFSMDYEVPTSEYVLWRAYTAYNRQDYSISWTNEYLQWELNVPPNTGFKNFIDIRLAAM